MAAFLIIRGSLSGIIFAIFGPPTISGDTDRWRSNRTDNRIGYCRAHSFFRIAQIARRKEYYDSALRIRAARLLVDKCSPGIVFLDLCPIQSIDFAWNVSSGYIQRVCIPIQGINFDVAFRIFFSLSEILREYVVFLNAV